MGSKRNGLPIRIDNSKLEELQKPKLTAYVDASDSDWGISSELIRTHGFWSEAGKENSIHKEQSKRKHVLLYSNNRTAIKYVMKQGGTVSPILQALALSIRELLTNNQITLTCQHIPGMQNTAADNLSRKTIPL